MVGKRRPWAPLRRRRAPGWGARAAPRSRGHGHTLGFGAHGGALKGHERDVRIIILAVIHALTRRRRQIGLQV